LAPGFLVTGPILVHTVGNWAWLAMAALCLAAYVFGAAVRWNIAHVEPTLAAGAPPVVAAVERLSHLALSFAYFISVAYYLNLFAAFVLRSFGIADQQAIRAISSMVILAVGGFGTLRGLRGLEFLEELAVGIKLSAIGGLVAAMAFSNVAQIFAGTLELRSFPAGSGLHEIQVLLGLVILVQGFETPRFLGSGYDAAMRIRTMKYAQWSSTAIYVVFMLLMTPFFHRRLPAEGRETAIIDVLAPLGGVAAPAVILAAICPQLSAAVADTNGASGLLNDATSDRISLQMGYVLLPLSSPGPPTSSRPSPMRPRPSSSITVCRARSPHSSHIAP